MYASGTGHHMYYVSIDHFVRANLWFHVNEALYAIATVLIKISACLFLLRIIGRATDKFLRLFLYALMVMMVVMGAVATIVVFAQCVPVAGAWDPRIKAKCFSARILFDLGYLQGGKDDTEINRHSLIPSQLGLVLRILLVHHFP